MQQPVKERFQVKLCKRIGRLKFVADSRSPKKFGPIFIGHIGISLKIGHHLFWLGSRRPNWEKSGHFSHEQPVAGDLLAVSAIIDHKKLKWRGVMSICADDTNEISGRGLDVTLKLS